MKTRTHLLLLLILIQVQLLTAQQSSTDLPKVKNHLRGDIDYAHEALDLVQVQKNGKEIKLGTINTDGTIHFNLLEFDIKALYDSIPLQHYDFHQFFQVDSDCKDRDVFAETPFDDVYSQKYELLVKKYGINVAILEPTSDNNTESSTYFWFYIDRVIPYNEECSKENSRTGAIYATVNVNIQFEKGWNFIEEKVETVENRSKIDSLSTQLNEIQFSKISPANNNIKWTLRQIQEDDKIQTAKHLDNLTPLTKQQFEKWMPNKLGDLSVTTKEHGHLPRGQNNKNNMHLVYTNETEEKEINLYVVDCAKSPYDMEMVNFAYAMEQEGKDEKDIKPYITQYNEREKTTQLFYKVEERIVVNASGLNINAEDLWGYIQKLNVEKLLKI